MQLLPSLSSSSPASPTPTSGTCKRTNNPYCVRTLSADHRNAKATTVRELAGVALDIAAATVRESSIGHRAQQVPVAPGHGPRGDASRVRLDVRARRRRGGAYRDAIRHQLAGGALRRGAVRGDDQPPLVGVSGG
uniref:Uncharacterized protein n=1 Tax=Oryza brachyantha TaxID=4533 RepID=J3MUW7_ORYBR